MGLPGFNFRLSHDIGVSQVGENWSRQLSSTVNKFSHVKLKLRFIRDLVYWRVTWARELLYLLACPSIRIRILIRA